MPGAGAGHRRDRQVPHDDQEARAWARDDAQRVSHGREEEAVGRGLVGGRAEGGRDRRSRWHRALQVGDAAVEVLFAQVSEQRATGPAILTQAVLYANN